MDEFSSQPTLGQVFTGSDPDTSSIDWNAILSNHDCYSEPQTWVKRLNVKASQYQDGRVKFGSEYDKCQNIIPTTKLVMPLFHQRVNPPLVLGPLIIESL